MNIVFSPERTQNSRNLDEQHILSSNKKIRIYTEAKISLSIDNQIKDSMRNKFIEENFPYNKNDFRCTLNKSDNDTDFFRGNSGNDMTDAVIFVDKIIRISRPYIFQRYLFTQTLDDYVLIIKKRFGHFKTYNNNHDVGFDMSMYKSSVEDNWKQLHGRIHITAWLAFRTERIEFLFKCFSDRGNKYTLNILNNFFININNIPMQNNIGPKINIGFEENFTIFNMIDNTKKIENLFNEKKSLEEIETNGNDCYLLDLIKIFKSLFRESNLLIKECKKILQLIVDRINSIDFNKEYLCININGINEINWEGDNLSDNVFKINKTNKNYLLLDCGINDILMIFDDMFKLVKNIMADFHFNKHLTKSEEDNLNINFNSYHKSKEHAIINYNNSQFHIMLYSLRDSKRPENFIFNLCYPILNDGDFEYFDKFLNYHSLGFFYRIAYYSFYLRPHNTIQLVASKVLNDEFDIRLPPYKLFKNLAKKHLNECFGEIDKFSNYLMFKRLVRTTNAYHGIPEYDNNQLPKVSNDYDISNRNIQHDSESFIENENLNYNVYTGEDDENSND